MYKAVKGIALSGELPSGVEQATSSIGRKRMLSPFTRNLCLFAIFNIVLVNCLLLVVFSTPWNETTLYNVSEKFLLVNQGADSWGPMSEAYLYTQSNPRQPLYSEIFFDRGVKFQYPPTSLLIISLLSTVRIDFASWFKALRIISWVFVVVMAIFTERIFEASLRQSRGENIEPHHRLDSVVRAGVVVLLVLTFYPVIRAYGVGQIQVWINSLFAVVLWCWMKEKKGIAGALVGIMCLLKPTYAIILLWGLLRKQWTFIRSSVAVLLIGLVLSVIVFGVADHFNYLKVLSFISAHGEAYYPNQSINGLLNRLLHNGNILEWEGQAFPPFNPWVYAGTLISSIALISSALFWPVKPGEKGSITDFSIIALTCTIASPVAWVHHYGILLPIFAFLLPALLKTKVFGKMTIAYLATSYFLTSNNFPTRSLAYTPLNIIMSYVLVGGAMVLTCLYFLRSQKQIAAVA